MRQDLILMNHAQSVLTESSWRIHAGVYYLGYPPLNFGSRHAKVTS